MAEKRIICGKCHLCGGAFGYEYRNGTSTEFNCGCRGFREGKRTIGKQGARVEGGPEDFGFRSRAFRDKDLYSDPIPGSARGAAKAGSVGADEDDDDRVDLGMARPVGGEQPQVDRSLDGYLRGLGWEGALYLYHRDVLATTPEAFATRPLALKYRGFRVVHNEHGLWYQPFDKKKGEYRGREGFIDRGSVIWTAGGLQNEFQAEVMYQHAMAKAMASGADLKIAGGNHKFKVAMFTRMMRDGIRYEDPEYVAFLRSQIPQQIDSRMKSAVYGF